MIVRGIIIKNKYEEFSAILFSKVSRRCPAIIFAARRTERVIGRIIFLVVSINTIKEERGIGVLFGTRCENILFVLLIHPKIIVVNHRGKARERVKVKWLEAVKI